MSGRRASQRASGLPGVTTYDWTEAKVRALGLMVETGLSFAEIAAEVGVIRQTVTRWVKEPEFAKARREAEEELLAETANLSIASKVKRLRNYDARYRRLLALAEQRGLLQERLRVVGTGPTAYTEKEVEVDKGLLKEIRELEKQAAIEMGQWTEKVDLAVEQRQPIRAIYFLDEEDNRRLDRLERDEDAGDEDDAWPAREPSPDQRRLARETSLEREDEEGTVDAVYRTLGEEPAVAPVAEPPAFAPPAEQVTPPAVPALTRRSVAGLPNFEAIRDDGDPDPAYTAWCRERAEQARLYGPSRED